MNESFCVCIYRMWKERMNDVLAIPRQCEMIVRGKCRAARCKGKLIETYTRTENAMAMDVFVIPFRTNQLFGAYWQYVGRMHSDDMRTSGSQTGVVLSLVRGILRAFV